MNNAGLKRRWRAVLHHVAEPAAVGLASGLLPDTSPEWQVVLQGLRELAGFARGVLYDVPRTAAPSPLPGTRVYLRGSPAWERYLAAREQVDDGMLTLLLALRPLPDEERLLVVDWGTTYANTFLLVEPRDPACDLTDPGNAVRRAAVRAARGLLRTHTPDNHAAVPRTRATDLGGILREAFGTWCYWTAPPPDGWVHEIPLALSRPDDTLAGHLMPALHAAFPQEAFDHALARLYKTEPELFRGQVLRARSPFRTRLGLPVLYDPYCVDRAMRRLVNEGHAWVSAHGPDGITHYRPGRPVPDSMTDAEFERLLM